LFFFLVSSLTRTSLYVYHVRLVSYRSVQHSVAIVEVAVLCRHLVNCVTKYRCLFGPVL